MGLNELQLQLERLYDLSTPHRVEDFVLSDARLARWLAGSDSGTPEQLLVREEGEDLEISLFLEQELLRRLEDDSPREGLHDGNLGDFWLAIEGVSHFLHLVCRADHLRAISRFELELIAEVDKFVTTACWLRSQYGLSDTRSLRRALFQAIRFRHGLEQDELQRYREANRLAARYCSALERRHRLETEDPALRRELRRFCRLSRADKIHLIEARQDIGTP